ncbi:Ubiquitin carboxyl-terminal hydrolase isozyme L3 [Penicillium cosmopolitanum]|uniref:Ubiquitin carboxyl-terminal hydrolase n=1 Tax=Penicillium cosmopolitanum TaxID=1131564 RepID=A0A9X0B452_9EURO|nr:Ubiquitin carboxyl-terminal hydrolase isozyme L3 [Penicillium cosmopolitanum]KAJ5387396.1 Ubiquitin carboxyl-terminal hydrolase isozyme L3 [Penicillium cosmopolitanum]
MTDNPDVPNTQKAFVPLENNPEVMSHLVHQLGLPKTIGFTDVFSIDEPDLLAFKSRTAEDSSLPEYTGSGPAEPVTWFKQTIRNACGLIGLLHAVSNGESKKHITPGSDLDQLLRDAQNLAPAQRADLLYESKALESAHADAAKLGDTAAPEAEDRGDDGTLWELDGRRRGPLARGKLAEDEDALSEAALALGVRRFLKTEADGGNPDLRFSLVSLGPLFD